MSCRFLGILFSPLSLRTGVLAMFLIVAGTVQGTAQVLVRSSLSQDDEVSPGATYERAIELYNSDDSTRAAEVSLRDYTFTYEGTTNYADPGTLTRSNAPWINYGGSTITLPPEEEVELTYQVDVPETIGGEPPVGTYWSMLLIEPLGQQTVSADQGLAVQQVRRYGIQVATHISGTGAPEVEILSTDLKRQEGQTALTVAAENMGTRSARPSAQLELYDEAGELVVEEQTSPKRVYPGTSAQFQMDLSGVSPGTYQGLLVLQMEETDPIGRQFTVDL